MKDYPPPPPKKKKKGSGSLPSPLCYHYYSVFFAHLLILQYPDHHQNLISSYLYYSGPVHKISSQSVHNFLSNVVHIQTNKQTNQRYQKHNLLCQGGNNLHSRDTHLTTFSQGTHVVITFSQGPNVITSSQGAQGAHVVITFSQGAHVVTRNTQRAQISLAEADHYSHIAHCKNVEPWL